MQPQYDYHMHTALCGHATGAPEEYVKQAIKLGLKEIGFSCHAPFVKRPLPGITMSMDELPQYHAMIEDVQKRFADQISIKIALEADYIPSYEEQTAAILEAYDYDYVIGSVHFIGDWDFDNPDTRETWNEQDVNQVYKDYYALLRQSAQTGMFDIIGHADLVKKFGHRPSVDLTDEITQTAKVFADVGVAVEINTAGLRKTCNELYPALDALKIYCAHGVPLTFGSDAHAPEQVGMNYVEAEAHARAAGYTEHAVFEQRLMIKKVPF